MARRHIQTRPFGSTGHHSTVTLFGGAALKNASQAEADETLDVLLEYGVNHLDTAPRYGDSELRIGAWMNRYRKDFFLATKTGERSYQGAKAEFQRSLERLRVDHVDLIQMHALYHPDEWETAMGEEGALAYLIEAKQQGLAKHIGVTGHGWTIAAMHLRSLARYEFDSVLLPYNPVFYANDRYRSEFDAVLALCRKRKIAVQTIKSIARGPWATTTPNYDTWYQPLENQHDIDVAVHWAMAQPDIFLNTVGDMKLLPKMLDAASRFENQPEAVDVQLLHQKQQLSSLFGLGT
jgi:aryl-alcohol dehydrogenase-like predicted oxidoreductase